MISERYFRRRAMKVNEVWRYGFLFDQTLDGRTLKVLTVVDEYTGECLVMRAGGSMKARDVFEALAMAARERGMPRHLRCDDVPAFIARKVKDWLQGVEAVTLHVERGDPTENARSGSFNGWLRDKLLGGPLFGSLEKAVVLLERARTVLSAQAELACQADLYLGQCYEKLEEHGLMYEAYKRVLTLDPSSVQAKLGMAAARWSQDRLEEARRLYGQVMQGQRVALVRDLTDTMYNPARRPFVSHFAGTRLMVEHVEKYWCPTITSAALLGGAPFRFAGDAE